MIRFFKYLLALISILSWISVTGCHYIVNDNSTSITGKNSYATDIITQQPLQIYMVGQLNVFSYPDGVEIEEYSTQVNLGLERSWYLPGYTYGNAVYQAILDFQDETGQSVEVTFFNNTADMVYQMQQKQQAGQAPDLVIALKQFDGDWKELLNEEAMEDLSPFLQVSEERYYTRVLQSGVYQEKQYVVPFLFNVNGYITSEEFLQEIGRTPLPEGATYEEVLKLLEDACIAMQGNASKLALYEGTTIWQHYIMNVLTAAAGYNGLEEQQSVSAEAVEQILPLMLEFLKQDFMTITNYEENTYEENITADNAKYDRFNLGPTILEDEQYKTESLGILLDGGYGGHLVNSSFIMQAYALQTYFHNIEQHMVLGGIPIETDPKHYAACVSGLAFCPSGAANIEGAGRLAQYLLDYEYPPELGISVNRDNVSACLHALTETSTKLYIWPNYNPRESSEIQQEVFEQSAYWFEPMEEKVAQQLRDILDQIAGASLPYAQPMEVMQEQLEAYYMNKVSLEEATEAIGQVFSFYWESP